MLAVDLEDIKRRAERLADETRKLESCAREQADKRITEALSKGREWLDEATDRAHDAVIRDRIKRGEV